MLLVDYDLLVQRPDKVLTLIYQFLGEEYFNHDFENVEYEEQKFDGKLHTNGLHTVRRKVELIPRETVLPPDLFEQFNKLSFWTTPSHSRANVIVAQPNPAEANGKDKETTRSPSLTGKANPRLGFSRGG